MSKSRARLLAELLNSSGLVKKSKSALSGADEVIDLDSLPTITNAKLENSSISIAGHSTALGASVTLNTGDIGEHTNYKYYTDARARAAVSVSGSTLSYNSTTGVITSSANNYVLPFTDNSTNWNTAYGWGNHASAGYRLSSESLYYKPTREASGSYLNLNTATTPGIYRLHGQGNHTGHPSGNGYGFAIVLDNSDVHGHLLLDRADDGRLWVRAKTTTSFATADWNRVWSSADFTDNSANWNTAYGWGNHASAGYVTSSGNTVIGTDTDLSFSGANVLSTIALTDGVITSYTNRVLTLANLGYTGETNATADQTQSEINALGITATGLSGTPNITVGSVTGTYFLSSGADTTPAGTTFANAFNGSTRVAYFDGAATTSVWWGSGNTPYAAVDATNGNLKLYVNDTSGNWHERIRATSSGVTNYGTTTVIATNVHLDSSSIAYYRADGASNEWKYLNLATNGTTNWDIATKNNDLSGALQFRPSGSPTNRTYIDTSGNWTMQGDLQVTTHELKITSSNAYTTHLNYQNNGQNFISQATSGGLTQFRNSNETLMEIASSGNVTIANDLTVSGNLTVQGTTTTLNTATLDVEDKNITLNYGTGDTSGSADGAGITIQDAVNSTTNATILWNASSDQFNFSHKVNVAGDVQAYNVYSQDYHVLNTAGNGWHEWATRSDNRVNLSVHDISSNGGISSATIHNTGVIYLGSTATANDQFAANNGTDIFIGTSAKGLRTYKDLHTNSGNNKYWHAGNDGPSSGLGADTLDGQHGSYYAPAAGSSSFRPVTGGLYGTGHGSSMLPIWQYNSSHPGYGFGYVEGSPDSFRFDVSNNLVSGTPDFEISENVAKVNGNAVWHAGNDGSSSGLDADTVDSLQASQFLRSDTADTGSGKITLTATEGLEVGGIRGRAIGDQSGDFIQLYERVNIGYPSGWGASAASAPAYGLSTHGGAQFNKGNVSSAPFTFNGHNIWHAGNDGTGSGLDADTLDSLESTKFPYYRGVVSGDWDTIFTTASNQLQTSGLYQINNTASGSHSNFPAASGAMLAPYSYGGVFAWNLTNHTFKLYSPHVGNLYYQSGWNNDEYSGWRMIIDSTNYSAAGLWASHNDGPSSGLDADTLDGQHGSYYQPAGSYLTAETLSSTNTVTVTGAKYFQPAGSATSPLGGSGSASLQAYTTGTTAAYMAFHRSGAYAINWGLDTSNTMVLGGWSSSTTVPRMSIGTNGLMVTAGQGNLWGAGNDGPSSGLDADTVDGIQGASFLRSDASDTVSGTLTFGSGSGFDLATFDIYGSMRVIRNNKSSSDGMYIGYLNSNSGMTRIFGGGQGSGGIYITGSGANDIKYNNSSVFWHAGNDGSGSGLDADTLDGYQKSDINPAHSHYRWTGISASSTQARRFVIMRLYACPAHWDSDWQDIHLKVWSESYEATNLKYEICGDYNGGNQNTMFQLRLKDAGGSSEHGRFRLVLGTPVDAGWDHSGQNTYYVDVYAEAAHYMNFTVAADFYSAGFNVNTLPTSGGATSVVYSSPAVSNITTFTEAKEHSYFANHKIWNDGNHGSASGLDADLLDGQHGSYYAPASHVHSYLPLTGGTVTGNLNVNGTTTLGNGNADQTHINDTLYLGATDSGDSHFYFGENSSNWYGDHWYWDSGHEVERYSRHAGTDTLIEKHDTRNTHKVQTNRAYERLGHSTGYQIGSYNSVAANSYKTSPIYVIGDNYRPSDTSVSGMYGIGYSHPNFWGTGDGKNVGWGQYTVENGVIHFIAGINGTWSKNEFNRNGNKVWDAGNDGSGSGLDADTVDTLHASSFLRSDTSDSITAGTTYTFGTSNTEGLRFTNSSYNKSLYIGGWSGTNSSGISRIRNSNDNLHLDSGSAGSLYLNHYSTGNVYARTNLVWHAGNDGPNSGLNADLLDGNHASAFLTTSGTAANSQLLDSLDSTDFKQYTWRSFTVGGDLDKFYPALFSVGNGHHGSSDLEIAQSNVHQNGSGHGAFYARFGLNITGWGHIPQMMTLREYSKTGQTYISKIADTDHATGEIGIWLRGSTTYYYRCSDGAIFNSVRCTDNQPFKSYDNSNDAYDITISHSTSVENDIFNSSAHTGKVLNTGNIGAYALRTNADSTFSGTYLSMTGDFKYTPTLHFYNTSNTTKRVSFDSNGGIYATGNITAYSDITLKENIEVIPNALEKVQEIRGVTFTRKDDTSDKRYSGVIAQEIEQVLPEVVETNEEGTKSVAYGNMVGLLIEAVKELKQEVEDLKTQLKER